jgi:hypothetical protein
MVKNINPSFVQYLAAYLKKLLTKKTGTITADQFQEQVTEAVNDYLKKHYGIGPADARSAIAQSTPEAECANAIKARGLHKIGADVRISHYKTQAEISKASYPMALATVKELYRLAENNMRGLVVNDWTSSTSISLPDMRLGKDGKPIANKKRQETVPFTPTSAVNCGQCWICKTDVMSYSGNSINKYNDDDIRDDSGDPIPCTTPCGDCEHVSAVMASYIAGMLKSGGFAQFYWASYYIACVECNRKKSNYIGVKLNALRGWEVDDSGVNTILDAVFPLHIVAQHGSEYNPIRNALTTKYNSISDTEKGIFRDEVRRYIVEGTITWCAAANVRLNMSTLTSKKIKLSFNVSKIIVAITGHLEVIMGPLQKKAKRVKKIGKLGQGPKRGGEPKTQHGGNDDINNRDLSKADDDIVNELEQFKNGVATSLNSEKTEEKADEEGETEKDIEAYEDMDLDEEEIYRNALIEAFLEKVKTDYAPTILDEYNSGAEDFIDLMDNLFGSMAEMTGISDPPSPAQPLPAAASSATANLYPDAKADLADRGSRLLLSETKKLPPLMIPPNDDEDEDELGRINYSKIFVSINDNDVSRPSSGKRSNTVVDGDKRTPTGKRFTPVSRTPIAQISDEGSQTDTSENETEETEVRSVPGPPVVYANEEDSQTAAGYRSASATPIIPDYKPGGKRLNKRQSKQKSQKRLHKNKTKRISYIKHKQTRKNKHSKKTKSKRSNKK